MKHWVLLSLICLFFISPLSPMKRVREKDEEPASTKRFVLAVNNLDFEEMGKSLESLPNIHHLDGVGISALHLLCKVVISSPEDEIKLLILVRRALELGVSVNKADSCKLITALHTAAGRHLPRIVRQLILSGAFVDCQDYKGRTPLMWAFIAKKNSGRFLAEVVRELVAGRANTNACKRSDNKTPLHLAGANFSEGIEEGLACLHTSALVIDSRDSDQETPLETAALYHNYVVMEFLLNAGANPLAVDRIQYFPLHHFLNYEGEINDGNLEKALELFDRIAHRDVLNAKDEFGRTPLHCGALHVLLLPFIRRLLTLPVLVNDVDVKDDTPLHCLVDLHITENHVRVKQLELLRMFLEHPDIKLDIKNRKGLTPVLIAQSKGIEFFRAFKRISKEVEEEKSKK